MTITDTFALTYTTRGVTYTLSGYDATTGLAFRYLGDQGFGLAPLHRITTRGPLQDGDSDIDFRLDPRVLQIPIVVKNESTTPIYQHYDIRDALLRIFRPQDSGVLTVTTNKGSSDRVRNIGTRLLGGLSFDVDPDSWHVRTVVQLRADDPTWYDAVTAINTQTFVAADFGLNRSASNLGTWIAYPTILVTGPVTNFKITNVTTGRFIEYVGTIAAGTTVKIDLSYGRKTVTNNATGANLIANISSLSQLATFAIITSTQNLQVTGTGTSGATLVTVSWLNRYTGI
jgi:hypothetical protein